ncbi:uncharacterized protein Z520_02874 [Fonsecaea multimorphosa CBS 102226]|uniref:Exoribonuclease phosphorolytic domain-containing protein n=1 Tax=Fonsecaea multimorphosa CBS 102226 TaxID=1442371 RepID=A0A0D2IWB6_9EURO|nr:uncharacterized protein Z520_02874 [Fonsecaea multimorphosa CBS 102226]KIY01322.1 hypothetical protein Z520_02874 [Fonsecaea multimorphosa CBS 102226]OAL28599.1 hypothetical protein AYO22_02793 [Fonsecaea multimorphosa]
MSDRRRINGPGGTTSPPAFAPYPQAATPSRRRVRKPNELRKIFLQTGIVPSASGSAYFELESPPAPTHSLVPTFSTIKLSCSVHGPKPLPRTASFSPNAQLTASVKFAPFATRVRQSYVPNQTEKDLGLHLENALKGALLPDRWPKSAVDVAVTVLEGEDNQEEGGRYAGLELFNLLAAAINVAMAALADAKIDCLDLLAAGVAAVVPGPDSKFLRILDPAPIEHDEIRSSCVVGYLSSRDEIVEVWSSGSISTQGANASTGFDELVDAAVAAARGAQTVLKEALLESLTRNQMALKKTSQGEMNDVEMNR